MGKVIPKVKGNPYLLVDEVLWRNLIIFIPLTLLCLVFNGVSLGERKKREGRAIEFLGIMRVRFSLIRFGGIYRSH